MVEDNKISSGSRTIKLVVVGVALFVLWFFILQQISSAIALRNVAFWILPTVLVIVFLPVAALAAVVFGPRVFFVFTLGLSLGYFVFFPFNIFAVLAVALLFFGFWRTYHRTQFELHNNVKFAPYQIVSRVSRAIVMVLLLVIAFNVYAAIANDLATDETAFYERLAGLVTKGVLPFVERQLTDFNSAESLDQFIIEGLVRTVPEFEDLPPEEREAQIAQSRQRILRQFNIDASGVEPLSEVTERAIEGKLKELIQPFSAVLPLVYGLAIFSLLRILGFFVELLARIWGIFLFWLLRKTQFLKVTTTQILAEHVEI